MRDNDSPKPPRTEASEPGPPESRFPELTEIQREVAARIKDNQRFLERFLDDDFTENEEPGEDPEAFEEL